MHILDELDEPKAPLRVLVELSNSVQGMNMTGLYRVMREVYNVGRPAVNTSYKALIRARLAEVYDAEGPRSKLRIIQITSLGEEVVLRIRR